LQNSKNFSPIDTPLRSPPHPEFSWNVSRSNQTVAPIFRERKAGERVKARNSLSPDIAYIHTLSTKHPCASTIVDYLSKHYCAKHGFLEHPF
jgi:hypothetical protein